MTVKVKGRNLVVYFEADGVELEGHITEIKDNGWVSVESARSKIVYHRHLDGLWTIPKVGHVVWHRGSPFVTQMHV